MALLWSAKATNFFSSELLSGKVMRMFVVQQSMQRISSSARFFVVRIFAQVCSSLSGVGTAHLTSKFWDAKKLNSQESHAHCLRYSTDW